MDLKGDRMRGLAIGLVIGGLAGTGFPLLGLFVLAPKLGQYVQREELAAVAQAVQAHQQTFASMTIDKDKHVVWTGPKPQDAPAEPTSTK